MYAPPAGVVKPFGEWNTTRIVVEGAHVEHWLNGQKVVTYELWSPDWLARVAKSQFAAYKSYGRAKKGYISIQGDHTETSSCGTFGSESYPDPGDPGICHPTGLQG